MFFFQGKHFHSVAGDVTTIKSFHQLRQTKLYISVWDQVIPQLLSQLIKRLFSRPAPQHLYCFRSVSFLFFFFRIRVYYRRYRHILFICALAQYLLHVWRRDLPYILPYIQYICTRAIFQYLGERCALWIGRAGWSQSAGLAGAGNRIANRPKKITNYYYFFFFYRGGGWRKKWINSYMQLFIYK